MTRLRKPHRQAELADLRAEHQNDIDEKDRQVSRSLEKRRMRPGEREGGEHQRQGEQDHVGWFGTHDDRLSGHDPDAEDDREDDSHGGCAGPQSEVDRTLRLIGDPRLHRRDHLG